MNKKARFVAAVALTAFIVTVLYILLHELGHTLVALACGARITEFSLVRAEMAYEGGNFSNAAITLFNAAGAALPVIIAVFALLFYHKSVTKTVYHVAWFFLSVFPTASLLPWAVIPAIAQVAEPPAGDDITKFLASSGLPPLAVAAGVLVIMLLMLVWIFKKGVPAAFVQAIKMVRKS